MSIFVFVFFSFRFFCFCFFFFFFFVNLWFRWKNYARAGKIDKIPLKEDDQELTDQILEKVRLATAKKEKAKSEQEKLSAASLLDEAKSLLKQVRKMKNISIYP